MYSADVLCRAAVLSLCPSFALLHTGALEFELKFSFAFLIGMSEGCYSLLPLDHRRYWISLFVDSLVPNLKLYPLIRQNFATQINPHLIL